MRESFCIVAVPHSAVNGRGRCVLGRYTDTKGTVCEESAVLLTHSETGYDDALAIAKAWGQESILSVDIRGYGFLVYMDGRPAKRLGRWREIPKDEAPKVDHTAIDGTHYTC